MITHLHAQCPIDCASEYSTEVDLDLLPDCNIGTDTQEGNLDGTMQDACFVNGNPDGLICHEFIFTRDDASEELQIQFRVGQGSMCTGDLDDAYQIIEGGFCIEFPEAMSSQTMV